MKCPELAISMNEILGIPRVALRGTMAGWHDQAVRGILAGLADQGAATILLDLSALDFAEADAAAGMASVLRSLGPATFVHVVTRREPKGLLRRSELPPTVRLHSSTDPITDIVSPGDDDLSRAA